MLLFWRQLFLSFRRNMFPCVINHPVAHNIQPEQTFLEDLRVGPWWGIVKIWNVHSLFLGSGCNRGRSLINIQQQHDGRERAPFLMWFFGWAKWIDILSHALQKVMISRNGLTWLFYRGKKTWLGCRYMIWNMNEYVWKF